MSIFDITLVLKDEDGIIVHEEEFNLVRESLHSLEEVLYKVRCYRDDVNSSYKIYNTEFGVPYDTQIFQFVVLAEELGVDFAEKAYREFIK